MSNPNKVFDDIASLVSNAFDVAQDARTEAQNAFTSMVERVLAAKNLVTYEEFEAVRTMATMAREENARLQERVSALEEAMEKAMTLAARHDTTATKDAESSEE